MNIQWLKYDPTNVPKGEVLAKNWKHYMVGHLDGLHTCYSGWTTLSGVTHYIPISDLSKIPEIPF